MKKSLMWLPILAIVALVGVVIYSSVNKPATSKTNADKIQIVSSLDFYAEMAQAVAGKQAQVHTIIDKTSIDPHDFEPTSSVAKLYNGADVIISNGGGYDEWSEHFAEQNTQAKSLVVADLVGYEGEHHHDDAKAEDYEEAENGMNEHLWYDITTPKKLVNALVTTLSKLDVAHAKTYQANGQKYLASLQGLYDLEAKAKSKLAGVKYLASEPVYDNTLIALGAKNQSLNFAQALEEGNDPTPTDIKNWRTAIDNKSVPFVINNPQNSSKVVTQAIDYAKAHGVPVINATETMPKGKTYVQWQEDQLKQVLDAVK